MILFLRPVDRYKFGSTWWTLFMVSVEFLAAVPKNQPGAQPWLCTYSDLCQTFSQGLPEVMDSSVLGRAVQDALHGNGKIPVTVAAAGLSRDKPDGGEKGFNCVGKPKL